LLFGFVIAVKVHHETVAVEYRFVFSGGCGYSRQQTVILSLVDVVGGVAARGAR